MDGVRWIALAEVARAHGVRGELRLKLYNPASEGLVGQSEVLLRDPKGRERAAEVQWYRPVSGGALVKLRGIDDRDAAQALQRTVVCVRRDALPPTLEGEYYVCDLVGARLVGPSGDLGVVEDVTSYPGSEALDVRLSASGERVEIPLVEAFIERVDVGEHLVVVRAEALDLWT